MIIKNNQHTKYAVIKASNGRFYLCNNFFILFTGNSNNICYTKLKYQI